MEKFILILQKYKKIWFFGLACVALAIIILVAILISNAARVKNAFDADSDIYNRMQVKITKTIKDLSVDVNKKQDNTDTQSEGLDFNDLYDTGYYDSEGNIVEDTEELKDLNILLERTVTLKKDGTTYYEKNGDVRFYLYERDGKRYMLTYDDFYGIKENDGQWVETQIEDIASNLYFNIELLKSIDHKKLKKMDGIYVPKKGYLEELAFAFLNIDKNTADKYKIDTFSIGLEKGKVRNITISYTSDAVYQFELIYDFTYNNSAIKVPKADTAHKEQ